MAVLAEPLPRQVLSALRAEVLTLRGQGPTKRFPITVHVGTPGGVSDAFVVSRSDHFDHALRCDVLIRLIERRRRLAGNAVVWLTRPGLPEDHDEDVAWLGAARGACLELGHPLTMVVITRTGWYDPRSMVGRRWRRLRPTAS